MKYSRYFILFIFFIFPSLMANDATVKLQNSIKNYFNNMTVEVKQAENAVEKRDIMNDKFDHLINGLKRIERMSLVSEKDRSSLRLLRKSVQEKADELNGVNGFEKVNDRDLDLFADYSRQTFEQADKTITLSLTTALLIIIIIILIA